MLLILETVFALLATLGLAFLLWLFAARRLLMPDDEYGRAVAVVRGEGSGEGLEQRVRELLWLRNWSLFQSNIVIVDCGLNEQGRALAQLLCANTDDILLCSIEKLSQLISDT